MTTDLTVNRDALVKDLKSVIGDADGLMKDVVNSTSEEFLAARQRIEAKIDQVRRRLDETRSVVSQKACYAADVTTAYVSENPFKVIGVVSLLGIFGACLLMRQSTK